MAITIYQYKGCSTCRKAMKWLDAQGLEYTSVAIVEAPPTVPELASMVERSGLPLKKFFNTSGQSYRAGGWKDKLSALSTQEKLEGLAADGKLIKRPLVDAGSTVLVGFRAESWAEALGD